MGKLRRNIDTHMHTGSLRVIVVDTKSTSKHGSKCLPTTECDFCQHLRLPNSQTNRIVA